MDRQLSDSELVRKAIEGDTEAFTILVHRYKDVAYAAAYSIVKNYHDAKDVAQEAWIRAYRRLATCDQNKHFGAWLHGISRRCAMDWLRIHRHLSVEEGLSAALDIPNPGPQPDEEQEYRELYEMVHRALFSLSEVNRETTVLYYINGYSQKDVSRILGVPLGTVKRRLHESRKLLRMGFMEVMKEAFETNRLSEDFTREVSTEMIEWYVKPAYTAELANFLWSIGEARCCSRAYGEDKTFWRSKLGSEVTSRIDEFVDFHKTGMSQLNLVKNPEYTSSIYT